MSSGQCFVSVCLLVAVCSASAPQGRIRPIVSLPPPHPQTLHSSYFAGYVSLSGNRSSYFVLVECESQPEVAPLMLWLSGGPGSSGLSALFTENGPYLLRNNGSWWRNPFGWPSAANVIFVDAPPGVGFSRDTPGNRTVWNDAAAARFNYEFISGFLELQPRFKGRALYVAGESYAGHFVPQLAALMVTDGVGVRRGPERVVVQNAALLKQMFRGLLVGNPCTGAVGKDTDWCLDNTDPTIGAFRSSHAFASVDPSIPTDTAAFPEWAVLFRLCGGDPDDASARTAAATGGPAATLAPPAAATAYVPWAYGPCSNAFLTTYLNRPEVAAALHADANVTWSLFSDIDYPTPPSTPGVIPEYAHLMNQTNVSLLLYSGDNDEVVNFLQTQTVVLGFGRERRTNFTPWYHRDEYVEGWWQHAGFFIEFDRVTWASVKGAGHMVPQYRPAAAHALLTAFLAGGLKPHESHPATIAPAPAGVWPGHGGLAPSQDVVGVGATAGGVAPWLVGVIAVVSGIGGALVSTVVGVNATAAYRRRAVGRRASSSLLPHHQPVADADPARTAAALQS